MTKLTKYKGIIPAFYACYNDDGSISNERIQNYTNYLINKGVTGLYVGGSSGECIYQTVGERQQVLEQVMAVAQGKITIIAHVAAPSTLESIVLAKHAAQLGVDAIAAIPPIYFHLPEQSIYDYWQSMSEVADCDFIIYNIPQTTGHYLSTDLFLRMLENSKVVGVKNSSESVLDITKYKQTAKSVQRDIIIFNGPDEQLASGLTAGAEAGIGGTYGVMPELFIKLYQLMNDQKLSQAQELQSAITDIIFKLLGSKGSLYSVIKQILAQKGMPIGDVRAPLPMVGSNEQTLIRQCSDQIDLTIQRFCS